MMKSTYHPRTNGQTERYSNTVIVPLCRSIGEQQDNWKVYIYPFTYPYNTQVNQSTFAVPFSLISSTVTRGSATIVPPTSWKESVREDSPQKAKAAILVCINILNQKTTRVQTRTRNIYKVRFDNCNRRQFVF